jgi:phosphohistidine phosphatase
MARWAGSHDVRPQLVVCSSAVRARQTLERMRPALGDPAVWIEVTLYAATADTLLHRVRALPDEVDDAMLVGHNPGLMDLALLLAAPGPNRKRARANVPTGALVELVLAAGHWADVRPGEARMTQFVAPRELA